MLVSKVCSITLKRVRNVSIFHSCQRLRFSHNSRRNDFGHLPAEAASVSSFNYPTSPSSFSCGLKCSSMEFRHFSTSSPRKKSRGGGNKMLDDSLDSAEYEEVLKLISEGWTVGEGHQVLVVQPYIKWGPKKKKITSPELMLDEAVALVRSLSSWKVVDAVKIGLEAFVKGTIFGKGNISNLATTVASNSNITAVFISVDKFTTDQYYFFTNLFNKPVFDRYSLVIQIFKEHAKTPESKLQVSLAELPCIIGHLSPHYDNSKKVLMRHQKRMETSLAKLRKHREIVRKNRQVLEFPVIAVVGYTNAGKTSLIKALTEEESMTPRNVLFATLDVTMHEGRLPCQLKVLYADTIGFIANLPIELIEPFRATLEDAMLADVILHVIDVSHPDHPAQREEVISTLEKLDLDPKLFESMITVGNKIDLMSHEQRLEIPGDVMMVSAKKNIGLNLLQTQLEKVVLSCTNRRRLTVRVKTGSEEDVWLRKEAAIVSEAVDSNNASYTLLKILITTSKLDIFTHHFIKSKRTNGVES